MRAAERLIPAPRHGPRMPPPARIGRNRERTVRGWGSGGVRVAVLQAQDPAGRAAEQPSRHYQRRGGDRVTPPDGRGARARGGSRPAYRKRPGVTRPRIWTGGRKHGWAMRHRVNPKPAGSKPKDPGRTGEAQPHLTADYPLEARASPAPLQAAKTAAKPRGHGPGRRLRLRGRKAPNSSPVHPSLAMSPAGVESSHIQGHARDVDGRGAGQAGAGGVHRRALGIVRAAV